MLPIAINRHFALKRSFKVGFGEFVGVRSKYSMVLDNIVHYPLRYSARSANSIIYMLQNAS